MIKRLDSEYIPRVEIVKVNDIIGIRTDLQGERAEPEFEICGGDATESEYVARTAGGDVVGAVTDAVENRVVVARGLDIVVALPTGEAAAPAAGVEHVALAAA